MVINQNTLNSAQKKLQKPSSAIQKMDQKTDLKFFVTVLSDGYVLLLLIESILIHLTLFFGIK